MPANFLHTDTSFPTFAEGEPVPQRLEKIQNYLFMLLEQLRYTLFNLDTGNFNKGALKAFTEGITTPITARIEDGAGKVAELALTVDGLALRVSNTEGSVSSLTQTAEAISAIVDNGEVSARLIVGIINGDSSAIIDASHVNITADDINLSGYVTFNALEQADGKTNINGGNLTTGTIAAEKLAVSNTFELTQGGKSYGFMGCGYGDDDRYQTYGAYLSAANGQNYFIATNAGARMTAGALDDGTRKAQIYVVGGIDENDLEVKGQAVMEAEGTRLVVNEDGVFVVSGNTTRRVVTEQV